MFVTAVDGEHVYWHSFNEVGSVIAYTDGQLSPPLPDFPLYQMQLATSRIERIHTPGFSSPDSFIVGQDAENLYVTTPEALVAVRKPTGSFCAREGTDLPRVDHEVVR